MDPNETLKQMLALAKRIEQRADSADDGRPLSDQVANLADQAEDAEGLAGLVLALDDWLKKGGFLPRQWERKA